MEDSDVEVGEKDPLVHHETEENDPSTKPSKDHNSSRRECRKTDETEKKGSKRKKGKECIKEEKRGESKRAKTDEMKKIEENDEDKEIPSLACPFFGVKNYLHQFYEKPDVKNLHIYEETPMTNREFSGGQESIFLVKRKEGLCSSSVFRLSLMLGGIILMMGTTALIVAACASRRATLVGKVGGVAVVDRVAAAHNAEVDALFLVALIALILGATVLTSALISRAFCTRPEYEDGYREGVLSGYDSIYEHPPFIHPSQKKVPATEEITQIQPWIGSSPFTYR